MQLIVTDHAEIADEGTIILIGGTTSDGRTQFFGADRRMAGPILEAAEDLGEVTVEVEGWQLWGGPR